MRVLTRPVAQFVAAVLVAFALAVVLTSWLSSRAAEREAIVDARSVTVVLGRSVVQPALTAGLAQGSPAAREAFTAGIGSRLDLDTVRRVKVWAGDGTIVWSDESRLVGQRYPLDEDELAVLNGGGSDAELSDLGRPENRYERGLGPVVEVYTRVTTPDDVPLLFESYFTLADVQARKSELAAAFRPVTLGGAAVIAVLLVPLMWWLNRRARRESALRERLLRTAVESSDAERRRIARDLHDGVVQDLAGAAFALAGAARSTSGADPAVASAALDDASGTVRRSLRSLRSLLVEIYPPDLHETGLSGALDDLLAPVEASGIATTLEVEELPELSATAAALVWRVAQEAVRNAVRHGRPSRVSVSVRATGATVTLRVADDGTGFDPETVPADRFGLRGMRDTIREAGGTLVVHTEPGAGTRVELEVAR